MTVNKCFVFIVSGNLTTANNNSDDGGGAMARSLDPAAEMDLEEFMPSEDPQISAALARAITDSEDEGGSLTSSTTPLTFSKEPSVLGDDGEKLGLFSKTCPCNTHVVKIENFKLKKK